MLLTIAESVHGALGPSLAPLLERATITRLGQGVDQVRRIDREARDRTLACLRDYAAELERLGVAELAVVGTSAMRDAENGAEFIEQAERILGVAPRVVSGAEEARLTFIGALSGLDLEGPVLVVDIGGGSTELIHGSADPLHVTDAVSLDVGSVRLTERHLHRDPPTETELALARQDVRAALRGVRRPPEDAEFVGVAGTVTTLVAVARQLDTYRGAAVHGQPLDAETVGNLARRLAELPLARRRELAGLEPARADVIVAGALLLDEALAWSQKQRLLASDRGVRWGILADLASPSAKKPPESSQT